MNLEKYPLSIGDTFRTYEFYSIGTKGIVRKRVQFQTTARKNIFNIAFGDVNSETDDFDDMIVSNNNDTEKVLATVANSVEIFLSQYPMSKVYAEGSTPARTRLYQISISKILEVIEKDYNILGFTDDDKWEKFEKNKPYSAFYIQLKSNFSDGKN